MSPANSSSSQRQRPHHGRRAPLPLPHLLTLSLSLAVSAPIKCTRPSAAGKHSITHTTPSATCARKGNMKGTNTIRSPIINQTTSIGGNHLPAGHNNIRPPRLHDSTAWTTITTSPTTDSPKSAGGRVGGRAEGLQKKYFFATAFHSRFRSLALDQRTNAQKGPCLSPFPTSSEVPLHADWPMKPLRFQRPLSLQSSACLPRFRFFIDDNVFSPFNLSLERINTNAPIGNEKVAFLQHSPGRCR